MRPKLIKRSLAAVLCSVMMLSQVGTSMSVLAAEEPVSETPVHERSVQEGSSETTSSSHTVYGWNEESLTLHYETGYAPAWEALSSVLPTSVSANTDEGVVDVAIKGWTYNESYDVNKTGTYLIESVIDEKYALGDGVSNYPAYVVIEDVQHLVSFSGLNDIIAAPGSNVDVLDGVVASDGDIEYTVGISSVSAVDGSGQTVSEEEIELGEDGPVLFNVVDGYTYTVHLVAFDEAGEITDAEPAVRYVYVRDIVQPRAPSLKKAPLLGAASPAITSIDQFSVDFVSGGTLGTASDSAQAYIWNATRSTSGHQYIYRVSYATSGIGDAAAGDIEIRVPVHLYKDRNGRYADKIELGVPLDTEVDEDSPDSRDVEFVYRIEGTEAVIYNRIPVSAASNGYVEIAYALSKTTFSYRDMSHSDEMTASIKAGSNTDEDTELPYGINTTAKVNRTEKKFPDLYTTWVPGWGDAPANASDYFYLCWEIRTTVDDYVTQPYNLVFTDEVTGSAGGTVEPILYKFAGGYGWVSADTVSNIKTSGERFDKVITRHDKATYKDLDAYVIHNRITVTLEPIDGVDTPTVVVSNRDFPYEKPHFDYPLGHFNVWKRGDGAYRTKKNGGNVSPVTPFIELGFKNNEYSRYDLGAFTGKDEEPVLYETQYGNVDGPFDYAAWMAGYPTPWTISTTNKPYWQEHPEYFNQIPVRYELIDDGVYIYEDSQNGGTDTTRMLTSDDFQIDQVTYQVHIQGSYYDEERCSIRPTTGVFTDDDILIISTLSTDHGNDWQQVATVNLKTGVPTVINNSRVLSLEGKTPTSTSSTQGVIKFADNVIGYKMETSNAYYYTEIDTVPQMSIKKSDYVMSVIGDVDSMALRNTVTGNVYETKGTVNDISDDNRIFHRVEQETDFARITERDSYLEKKVTSVSNDKIKKTFSINWKITQKETVIEGMGITSYVPQDSGTFYDLLPAGMHVNLKSVSVKSESGFLQEGTYETEVISNYKDSGRDLLKVKVLDPGDYYELFFTTVTDWDGIKDFGFDIYNPVAYETGNDQIKYGYPDNGGGDASSGQGYLRDSDKELMSGLDPSRSGNLFIYSGEYYDIAAITAANANVRKHIRSSEQTRWTYSTETTINGEYFYRLRFMSAVKSTTKDIILFDSLENYRVGGTDASDWHGTLQDVDVSQMRMKGAAPVVYLSSVSDLDLDAHHDLSDTAIWTKMSEFGDIADAKAIAIDIRKDADGNDFELPEMESVVAVLKMKAPVTAETSKARTPVAFNNVYISDVVTRDGGQPVAYFDHHDYTQITFVVKGDFSIHKTAEDDGSEIRNIKFRLIGTSDYGQDIDMIGITNRRGNAKFEDIPKGTYTFFEYEGIPDYLENHDEHVVQIDASGNVLYDGVITNDIPVEVTNAPRVHADVAIIKRDNSRKNIVIPDTTFKLSGISEYGTEVVMVETTGADGTLVFSDLEWGTYELEEITANPGYINDGRKYTMIVDETSGTRVIGADEEKYTAEDPAYTKAKYAVTIYDIEADYDENGNVMGLTFGPAISYNPSEAPGYVSHTPTGTTASGNAHRCLHNDDWETIVEWNYKDPYVYEQCIGHADTPGCTKSVPLDLSVSKIFGNNEDFAGAVGDGPNALETQIEGDPSANGDPYDYYDNAAWNPINYNTSGGTNYGGWGASRIRAMMNGFDNLTMVKGSYDYTGNYNIFSEEDYDGNDTLFACFPKELRDAIGKRKTRYDSVYYSPTEENLKVSYDKLWLLSPNEIYSQEKYNALPAGEAFLDPLNVSPHPLESDRQYKVFEAESNNETGMRIAYYVYEDGAFVDTLIWLRSVLKGSQTDYNNNKVLYMSGGSIYRGGEAAGNMPIAPCFALSRTAPESIDGPEQEDTRWAIYNEPYHTVYFEKLSNLTKTGLAGAKFRLYGTSNLGHTVDMEAFSAGENGTVRFPGLESGTYTLEEIEAPEGYALDTTKYVVKVNKVADPEIYGLNTIEEAGLTTYQWFNVKKRDKEIVVTKKWVDGLSNDDRPMPNIVLTTVLPDGATLHFNVVYHANGGTFSNGTDTNTVRYEATFEPYYGPMEVVVHSDNIDDDGNVIGSFNEDQYWAIDDNYNCEFGHKQIITIPRASSLQLTVQYDLGTSNTGADIDGFIMRGAIEETFDLNAMVTYMVGKNDDTLIIDQSDSVTINLARQSHNGDAQYGYYGTVIGYDENGEVIRDTVNVAGKELANVTENFGTYEAPVNNDGLVAGWYIDHTTTDSNNLLEMSDKPMISVNNLPKIMHRNVQLGSTIHVYAQYDKPMSLNGAALNRKLMSLGAGSATAIIWSATPPIEENKTEDHIISSINSVVPVYAWYDENEETIYMWSQCDDIYVNNDCSYMFANFKKLTDISGLSHWNTENVKDMESMFYGCSGLTNLDGLAGWNTGNVTDMGSMFYGCSGLTNVDGLANWNTGNVTNMQSMLQNCSGLTNLEAIANWNTGNVTNMSNMFRSCSVLTNVDGLANWNTGKITDMRFLFDGCSGLTNINGLANWNTGNVTNMNSMFSDCSGLTNVNDVAGWNTEKVTDMSAMFYRCRGLTNLEAIANWNTEKVTDMGTMFDGCSNLVNVDSLRNWNTGKVTDMSNMFRSCSVLTNVDGLANWNTGNVTDMRFLFNGCSNLVNLNGLENWNTENVTDMTGVFYACNKLADLGFLAKWNTENVTSMSQMFYGCSSLTSLNALTSWNTGNVTIMNFMFQNCGNLTDASGINSWASNINNVTDFKFMFRNANSKHPDWSSVYPNGTWESYGTFKKNN